MFDNLVLSAGSIFIIMIVFALGWVGGAVTLYFLTIRRESPQEVFTNGQESWPQQLAHLHLELELARLKLRKLYDESSTSDREINHDTLITEQESEISLLERLIFNMENG